MNTQQAVKKLTDTTIEPQSKESILRYLVLAGTVESEETLYRAFENLRKKYIWKYKAKWFADQEFLESDLDIIFLEALDETRRRLRENPQKIVSTATFISNQFKWKIAAWYKDKYLSANVIEVPFDSYDLEPYRENQGEQNKAPRWLQEIDIVGGMVIFNVSQFKDDKFPELPLSQEEKRYGKELEQYYYRYFEYRGIINEKELRLLLLQLDNQKQKAIAEKENLSVANVKQIHSRAKKKIGNSLMEDYYSGRDIASHFKYWVGEQLFAEAAGLYQELLHYFPDFVDLILMHLDGCISTLNCSICKSSKSGCEYEKDGYPHFLNYRELLLSTEPLEFKASENSFVAALKRFCKKDPFPEIIIFGNGFFNPFRNVGLFKKMACLEKLENKLTAVKSLNLKIDSRVAQKIKYIKEEVRSLARPIDTYYDLEDEEYFDDRI